MKKVNDLMYEIRRQLPQGATTWSTGVCGHSARGGGTCIECLERDLADIVGVIVADAYVIAKIDEQKAIYDINEAVSKLAQ